MNNRREKFMRLACIAGLLLAAVQGWGQVAPVVHWRFEGGTPSAYLDDISPSGGTQDLLASDISFSGTAGPVMMGGVGNSAYLHLQTNFAVPSGFLYNTCFTPVCTTPTSADLLGTTGLLEHFTYMAWIRPGDLNGYYPIDISGYFSLYLDEGGWQIQSKHEMGGPGKAIIPFVGPVGSRRDPCYYIRDNAVGVQEWIHIALRYNHDDANQWTLFVDGQILFSGNTDVSGVLIRDALGPCSVSTPASPCPPLGVQLHAGFFGMEAPFRAANDIDEVLFYNVPVCDINIREIYDDYMSPVGPAAVNTTVDPFALCGPIACGMCALTGPPLDLNEEDFPIGYDFDDYDVCIPLGPPEPTPSIAGITQNTLEQIQSWPLPRYAAGSSIHRNVPFFVQAYYDADAGAPQVMEELSTFYNYTYQVTGGFAQAAPLSGSGLDARLFDHWNGLTVKPPTSLLANWEAAFVDGAPPSRFASFNDQTLGDDHYFRPNPPPTPFPCSPTATPFLQILNASCARNTTGIIPTPPSIITTCLEPFEDGRVPSLTPADLTPYEDDGNFIRSTFLDNYISQYGLIDYVTENGEIDGKYLPLLNDRTYCCLTNFTPFCVGCIDDCNQMDTRFSDAFQTFRASYSGPPLTNDENVRRCYREFVSAAAFDLRQEYKTGLTGSAGIGHFDWYHVDGRSYHEYNRMRNINDAEGGFTYATPPFYPAGSAAWARGAGDRFGFNTMEHAILAQIASGDPYFAPYVSPGYDNADTRVIRDRDMMRPGQYLGLLKALAMQGAEYYHPFYFEASVCGARFHHPRMDCWQMITPSLAQGITSRYMNLYRESTLMLGGYNTPLWDEGDIRFDAGKFNFFVYARKCTTAATTGIFLINGFVGGLEDPGSPEPSAAAYHSNTGIATIELGSDIVCGAAVAPSISFEIRRQGSTYIFDNRVPGEPVFYQLDRWHEGSHYDWWTHDFEFEAEVWDANEANDACMPFLIRTINPLTNAPVCDGNFSNFTSFTTIPCPSECYSSVASAPYLEYNFHPREAGAATDHGMIVWVRARTKGNVTGFNTTLNPGGSEVILPEILVSNTVGFQWYQINTAAENVSVNTDHVLRISAINSDLEIDAIHIDDISDGVVWVPAASATACEFTITGPASVCTGDAATFTIAACGATPWPACADVVWDLGDGTVTTAPANAPIVHTYLGAGPFNVTAHLNMTGGSAFEDEHTVSIGALDVVITGPMAVCPGAEAILTATALYGGAALPLTYTWESSVTGPIASVADFIELTGDPASGVEEITVTVETTDGCMGEEVFAITHADNPVPVIDAPLGYCLGAPTAVAVVTPPAYASYLWSNGATVPATMVLCAGGGCDVSVTVTNAFGCEGEATVHLLEETPPIVTLTTPEEVLCPGENIDLVATAIGGTAPLSYTWAEGPMFMPTPSASLLYGVVGTPGTGVNMYEFTASTPSGCASSAAVIISHIPNPTITSSSLIYCDGMEVTLTASFPPGTTGVTYMWSTGETTSEIIVHPTGPAFNVSVVATAEGCAGLMSEITLLEDPGFIVYSDGPDGICSSATDHLEFIVVGPDPMYNYTWEGGTGTTAPGTIVTLPITGDPLLGTHVYKIEVSNALGCTVISEVTVTHCSTPDPVISSAPSFCIGSSISFTASDPMSSCPITYVWSTGDIGPSTSVTPSGSSYTIEVTGTNEFGCSGTTSLTIPGYAPTPISITGPGYTCSGEYITLQATPGMTSYTWSTGATTAHAYVSEPGTYSVTAVDVNGCISSASFTVGSYTNCCLSYCPGVPTEVNKAAVPDFEYASCALVAPVSSSFAMAACLPASAIPINTYAVIPSSSSLVAAGASIPDHGTMSTGAKKIMIAHNNGGTFNVIWKQSNVYLNEGGNYSFRTWIYVPSAGCTGACDPTFELRVVNASTSVATVISSRTLTATLTGTWFQLCGKFSPTIAGNYHFEIRARKKAMVALDDIRIYQDGPIISIPLPTYVGTPIVPTVSPADMGTTCSLVYSWCFTPPCSTTVISPIYTPADPGYYTFRVSCPATNCDSWYDFEVLDLPAKTAEPDPTALFSVHPNPSFGLFEVAADLPDTGPVTLTVTAANGVRIVERTVETSDPAFRETLDLQQYAAGVYTLNVTWQGQQWLYRLVKQ